VTWLQGELFLRDEGCTGTEKYSIWEVVLKKEVCYQFIKAALEFSRACLAFPVWLVIALDGQVDGEVVGIWYFPGGSNTGTQSAAASIELGLRQVQRILAFDTARADIVANRIADDLPMCVDNQSKLWVWQSPH